MKVTVAETSASFFFFFWAPVSVNCFAFKAVLASAFSVKEVMIYKYMKYTRQSLFKDVRVSRFQIIILELICFRCLEVCRPS